VQFKLNVDSLGNKIRVAHESLVLFC
jgi:hypothetical protein